MKILHVTRTYFPDTQGGIEEAIRQISNAVSKVIDGVEIKVFALSPNPSPPVIRRSEAIVCRSRSVIAPANCDMGWMGSVRMFSDLTEWADVIHYHYPWPFSDVLHMLVNPKASCIMTYHSDIVRQQMLGRMYVPLMNWMLRQMDAIVLTSESYVSSSIVFSDGKHKDKLKTIPLGIDELICGRKSCDQVFNKLGITAEEPYFLFIGVLRYYKGLHTLVDASRNVRSKIIIAGDGPEMDNLKQQADMLGLNNVLFAGYVNDEEKMTLMRDCLAFVLPSHLRSEAFGMALVEAAMCGKPMISCEIGTGTSYVNKDGETGWVVDPENAYGLAEKMNKLLNDSSMVERFGRAARSRYESLFSSAALGNSYAQLYQGVVVGRAKK